MARGPLYGTWFHNGKNVAGGRYPISLSSVVRENTQNGWAVASTKRQRLFGVSRFTVELRNPETPNLHVSAVFQIIPRLPMP